MAESRTRSGGGSGSVTIALIAEENGVSIATVSKVLNGRPDVAEQTRARIEASLRRHGYRRRSRYTPTRAGQVDLVFQELSSSWVMEVIRGVEAVTSEAAVDLVVSQLRGKRRPPPRWAHDIATRAPAGVLIVGCGPTEAQREELLRQRIPMVMLDDDSATAASVPAVGSNNFDGGRLAARHLLGIGHRRIAMISAPEGLLSSRAKVAGFRSANEEAGVTVDPTLVRYGNVACRAGYEHGLELLSLPDRPTAVVAGSDLQAVGIVGAAHRLSLHVPADVSVVGYGNLPEAEWMGIRLTTVDQRIHVMAGTAARMVLDLAAGFTVSPTRIDLVAELVLRESTAPPRSLPATAGAESCPPFVKGPTLPAAATQHRRH